MKHTPAIVCLLAIVLGAVSAAVTTAFLVDGVELELDESPVIGTPAVLAREDAGLRDRVLELATENRELRDRIDALERATPTPRVPVGEYAAEADLVALRDEIHQWMAGREGVVPGAPELEELVGEALSSIRKEEAIAKVEKAQAAKAAALDARVEKVSEWLGLDGFQADEMRALLVDKDAREGEFIRMWREGADDAALAETKQANIDSFLAAAGRILTPQQFDRLLAKAGRGAKTE